jgi:hypothetical protein
MKTIFIVSRSLLIGFLIYITLIPPVIADGTKNSGLVTYELNLPKQNEKNGGVKGTQGSPSTSHGPDDKKAPGNTEPYEPISDILGANNTCLEDSDYYRVNCSLGTNYAKASIRILKLGPDNSIDSKPVTIILTKGTAPGNMGDATDSNHINDNYMTTENVSKGSGNYCLRVKKNNTCNSNNPNGAAKYDGKVSCEPYKITTVTKVVSCTANQVGQ